MTVKPFPAPALRDPVAGLGELVRLVLGDGLGAFPFSAGASLEALFDRMEGVK